MRKRLLVLVVLMAVVSLIQAQTVESKKCKTCGRPLKECRYKGRHPQPATTTPTPQPATTTPTQQPTTPTQQPVAKEGAIYITSTPSGTVVKVDGKYRGETPMTLEKQTPGSYTVTFSAEGYESSTKTVSVTAGNTATCHATLKKKQVAQQQVPQTTTTTTSPQTETVIVNGVSFKMIRVEGGSTGTFYIGETEVTQALWQAVMGSNPSYFKGSNRPVENVSWNDCKEFFRKLNSLTGKTFRLPKESEWEYAAKGGSKSRGYTYSGCNSRDDFDLYAWYIENAYYCGATNRNSSHPDYGTHNVKTKRPNELGIYDMSGNVMEWCEDLYSRSGSDRVQRGGSWLDLAMCCRVSSRFGCDPSHRSRSVGFRLAR